MLDDINETASARSYMSFNLNFAIMMLNCGRHEEANRCIKNLVAAIDQLPEDLHINVNKETDNA